MWTLNQFNYASDTKEACIARIKQMRQYQPELRAYKIMIQRNWCPTWLVDLVRATPFDFIAYYRFDE